MAVKPRETRVFGDEPRENVLVGQGSSCPGGFVTGGHLFKASLAPGNQGERAASDVHRERWVLHPAPSHEPATEGVRVKRIGVAPLLSRAIVKARRWIGPTSRYGP
jgi:hypothetical protein